MHDEVAHESVVDGLLRFRPPCSISAGVVGINADDVQLAEVAEFDLTQIRELATEHEMQQLSRLTLLRHGLRPLMSLVRNHGEQLASKRTMSDAEQTARPDHANSANRS